jgi:L-ascorbate metabolism protein UlaG (beta-lactamase superfamily)
MKLDFGTVRYVNAIHSSQFSDGTYGGNPGGFVIESAEGNFYFAGDTALTMDMKLIPFFCHLKFAMLPIGGYFTMDFSDAILASDFLECNKIIGMHYDTFPPIKIDPDEAIRAFKAKGKELVLMNIGDTLAI